jgi:hypothetical protein
MSDPYIAPSNLISRAGAGVVGGIAGGIVLAAVLTAIGHIREMGAIVGRPSIGAGWVVVMVVCAIAGAGFGALAGRAISGQLISAIGVGIFYGGALWILFELVVVPLRNHGSVFTFDNDSMFVLAAWVAFGVALGVLYALTGPKRRYYGSRWRGSYAYNMVYAAPRRVATRRRRRRSS